MYNEELEGLIEAALADGVLTDKEKQILFKKADSFGIDHDEFEMVLNARLAKVQRVQQPTRAAKEKIGNIVTCPNCGAQIPGGAAKCPECGFEFRNVEVNRSVQRFAEGLNAINDKTSGSFGLGNFLGFRSKKSPIEQYISSFPVPNTAADLLEFLAFVQGQARKHNLSINLNGSTFSAESLQENAYWDLYEKCINIAKISFANDQRFIPYFENYEKQRKKMPVETRKLVILISVWIGFMAICILPVIFRK